jgi:hypothetical protein
MINMCVCFNSSYFSDVLMLFLNMSHIHIYMLYNHVIITCHIIYWWTAMFKVNKEFEFELSYSTFQCQSEHDLGR